MTRYLFTQWRHFGETWHKYSPCEWALLTKFLPRCWRWEFCLSVCLSVRLSVKRVHCDKTEERSVQIFMPYERAFSLVFWEEDWFLGATPFTWNFGSTDPCWSEIADFEPIFARSASAVTYSEKSSINTNRKSTSCRVAIFGHIARLSEEVPAD